MKKFKKFLMCVAACVGIDVCLGIGLQCLGPFALYAAIPVLVGDVYLMVRVCKSIWRMA